MAAPLYACCQRIALVCTRSTGSANLSLKHLTRWYARGIRRTPITVKTPEEDLQMLKAKGIKVKDPRLNPFVPFIPGDPTQTQFTRNDERDRRKSVKPAPKSSLPSKQIQQNTRGKKTGMDSKSALKDISSSGLTFEKLQEGDKRFGHVLMVAKSRKEREKSGLILLEGRRLILDSLRAGAQLKYLYFTDASVLSSLPMELIKDAALYKVQYRHLKLWADTQNPAGILGVFAKPAMGEVVCPQRDSLPLTLICDNIRDPGNLGTIIRTAAAVGCKKIITTKGCVDVWDPKVLRGAMGGHFYTCVLNSLPWDQVVGHIPRSCYLCIADSRKGSALEKSFDISHPKVIELLSTSDASVSSGEEETSDDDSSSTDEESSTWPDEEEERDESGDADQQWSAKTSEPYKHVPLSVVLYSDMDCSAAKEVTVIVGGETKGVSAHAKKLAFDMYGQYVTIPMVESADSLNTAIAAAIVLYEARRQLTLMKQRSRKGQATQDRPV